MFRASYKQGSVGKETTNKTLVSSSTVLTIQRTSACNKNPEDILRLDWLCWRMDGSDYKASEWESEHQIVASGFYPTQKITQAIWFPGIYCFLCVSQSWLVQSWLVQRGRLQMWNPDLNTGSSSDLVGSCVSVTFMSQAVIQLQDEISNFYSTSLSWRPQIITYKNANSKSYTRWVITFLPKNFIISLLLLK